MEYRHSRKILSLDKFKGIVGKKKHLHILLLMTESRAFKQIHTPSPCFFYYLFNFIVAI